MKYSETTQEKFNKILAFNKDKEKLQFEAEMLHLNIIHSIQCLMKEKCLNKTDMAKQLGVSKGYLTQLFSGDKLLNLKTLAKIQRIFEIKFYVGHESNAIIKLKSIEKRINKPSFVRNTETWKKKYSKTGKTYEFREIPRDETNTKLSNVIGAR